jgi:hypothetical protein
MNAPRTPPEPTYLPSTALGWIALALMTASILSFAMLTSDALPDNGGLFFSIWEERMLTLWLATGFVGLGSGIAALLTGDRALTTLLIVLLGVPASLLMVLATTF